MKNFIEDPVGHNKRFLDHAREAARDLGEGFIVFMGNMAVYASGSKMRAQDEARSWAAKVGRDAVKVKRIKV